MLCGTAAWVVGCAGTSGVEPAHVGRSQGSPSWQRYEYRRVEMGVPFRMVLYATNEAQGESAAAAAWKRLGEMNARLSDYDAGSELSRLSRSSGSNLWVAASEDVWRVLSSAQAWSRRTDGAFDVTIGPVVNLWRQARRRQEYPRADRLAEALARVGYRNVELDNRHRRVLLRVPDMRLDVGGIAKGFAADEALKVLREHGVRRALVAAAGDIAVGDAPPDAPGWRVEIASAQGADQQRIFVTFANGGVSTSGDVFQFVELGGVRYSHIVDPHTGVGLTNQLAVTVTAANGMTADALATALMVMGEQRAVKFARQIGAKRAEVRKGAQGPWLIVEYDRRVVFNAAEK